MWLCGSAWSCPPRGIVSITKSGLGTVTGARQAEVSRFRHVSGPACRSSVQVNGQDRRDESNQRTAGGRGEESGCESVCADDHPAGADLPPVPRGRARQLGGQARMSVNEGAAMRSLSFRRIVDVPFETCLAALDSGQRTGHGGEIRSGRSQMTGPMEHVRDTGTRRIEVRLARGPLRPLVRMRLDIDRWSSSSTALELIPCGRVRPTAAYFRAGHLLLDSLTRSLPQHPPPAHARDTASQPPVPAGSRHP